MEQRVETDFIAFSFVAFGEFEVVDRVTTVVFGKFLFSGQDSKGGSISENLRSRKYRNQVLLRIRLR